MKEELKKWLCEALDFHVAESVYVLYERNEQTKALVPFAYILSSVNGNGAEEFEVHFYQSEEIRYGYLNLQSAVDLINAVRPIARIAPFSRHYCS